VIGNTGSGKTTVSQRNEFRARVEAALAQDGRVCEMHFRWRRRLPWILATYPHVRLRWERDVERFLAEA
jgi:hypothetical protein